MNTHAEKTQVNKGQPVNNKYSQMLKNPEKNFQLTDNRTVTAAQRKLFAIAANSAGVKKTAQLKLIIGNALVKQKAAGENKTNLKGQEKREPGSSVSVAPTGRPKTGFTTSNYDFFFPAATPVQRQPFGLAHQDNIEVLSDQSEAFERTLKTHGVGETIELAKMVLGDLLQRTDPNIPLPHIIYGEIEDPLTRGQFASREWTVTINSKAYPVGSVTAKELPALMNTLYHEARHCEQYWHAARKLATSAPGNVHHISGELNIPPEIAAKADKFAYPGKKKASKAESARFEAIDGWIKQFQSTGQKAMMARVLTGIDPEKVDVENKLNEAKEYLRGHQGEDDDPTYIHFKQQYDENYDIYRNWAHEEDAWNVGMQLELRVAAKLEIRLKQTLRAFLQFFKSIDEDPYKHLSNNVLTMGQIRDKRMFTDEVMEIIEQIRTTYQRISALQEPEGEKYSAIVSLLAQSSELALAQDMEGAAGKYQEAMVLLNEQKTEDEQ